MTSAPPRPQGDAVTDEWPDEFEPWLAERLEDPEFRAAFEAAEKELERE